MPAVSTPSPESASPWQQTDLLTLLAAVDRPASPEPVAAEPPAPGPTDSPPVAPELPDCPGPSEPAAAVQASCPTTLLILDTETTALDPEQGHCIEVGAILFHVPQRAVLAQVSFLLPAPSNPAEHVNGIPAAVTQLPQPWQAGLACFQALLAAADAVLAHNAAFDRRWFGRGPLPAIAQRWICSMEDIRWPAERHLRPNPSVRDLALAYGVPVWAAHRALTDCTYLAQVLERCDDLEQLLIEALEPRQLFRARVPYAERQRAKAAGFRWNDPVPGAWSRRLSEREVRALPFPVQLVEADAEASPAA